VYAPLHSATFLLPIAPTQASCCNGINIHYIHLVDKFKFFAVNCFWYMLAYSFFPIKVRHWVCLFAGVAAIAALATCGKKGSNPEQEEPAIPPLPATTFAQGADVSWVTQMEAAGIKWYNAAGTQTECMALMKALGMNTIRLRVWVNPADGWNNQADVVAKALRAKNAGMRVMINFHYSDTWADPGSQTKPAAWTSPDIFGLATTLSEHTKSILQALKAAGVTPEWVQVGNETNDGMLWPNGKASAPGGMANYARLVNAGYYAVKSVFPTARVIVHLSNGWDNDLYTWNIGGLISNGAKFDVIGLSLYPTAADWSTRNSQCVANMTDLINRYQKEVMVVEVGMPWDQAATCRAFLTDLINKVKNIPANKGIGVLYWEPQCYGNWQGYTLGAFDNSGKPTEAMLAFAP
jgi:arabinogalactan endo-1,4-beta-galactosidase